MTGDKLINAQTFEFADPESGGVRRSVLIRAM